MMEVVLAVVAILIMVPLSSLLRGCAPTLPPPQTARQADLVVRFSNRDGLVPPIARILICGQTERMDPEGRTRLGAMKRCTIKAFDRNGKPFLLRCPGMSEAMPVLDLDTEHVTTLSIVCEGQS
jgi:hypothetical protein